MQPGKLIARLAILSAATMICLLLAFLAPAVLKNRVADEAFTGASVMASPRDMLVITQPVTLSNAPGLTLLKGALYADGNAALGTPISRFVLDNPVFAINVMAPVAREVPAGVLEDVTPLVEQLLAFGYDTLIVRRGQAQILSGDPTPEVLSDIDAEVSGRRKGQFSVRGSLTYRGQRVKFETSAVASSDKKSPNRWQVKAALKSAFVDASFDGAADATRDLRLSGSADVVVPSLRRVARWLSVPVPNAEGLNAATFKGQLTWDRNALSLEQAKVSVDGNEGAGSLSLNLSSDRPLIDGTLAFSAFDLSPYVEGLRPQTFGFERPSTSWANFDLSFPLLRYVDTDLRISTPRLTYKSFEIGRTAATLTVRAGKLLADFAEMELGTATASLELTADTNEVVPRFVLKGKVQNFDATQSASALLAGSSWSGKGTITLDLSGSGQAPIDVIRSLTGKAAIQMPLGARVPVDIKSLKTATKQAQPSGWASVLKGQTTIDVVDVKVSVAGGILSIEQGAAKSGAGAGPLGLAGSVDLTEAAVDLRLSAGPETVRLFGPLSAPTATEYGDPAGTPPPAKR